MSLLKVKISVPKLESNLLFIYKQGKKTIYTVVLCRNFEEHFGFF